MNDPSTDNQHRIETWRRTRDLAALWPDLGASRLQAAHHRMWALTSTLLREPSASASLDLGGDADARALGVAAFMAGMGPLMGFWLETGRIRAPGAARELFARHLNQGRRRTALLHERLAAVIDAMHEEGIRPIVLKGTHTGCVHFPEPATRTAADIDLLVRPTEREAAGRALSRAGLVERRRTVWADRSEWEPRDASREIHSLELEHADDPWSVDLHSTLDRWYFRGLRRGLGARAHERTSEVVVAGKRVLVLGEPLLLVFLAQHASQELAKMRLIRLVELALVLQADFGANETAWHDAMDLIRRAGLQRFVQPALTLTADLVPDLVPGRVRAELDRDATPRLRRVLSAVRAGEVAPLMHRSLDSKLMWASGPREVFLNVSELIAPSDDGETESLLSLYRERVKGLLRGRVRWRAERKAE